MTFKEQYTHPKWQKKRLEVLENYGFECSSCGGTENTLHVHHKIYRKNSKIWEYDNDELDCLCERCHGIEHHIDGQLKERLVFLGCGEKETLIGFSIAYHMPMFLNTSETPERIRGKVLGHIGSSKFMNKLEDMAIKDIVDGNVDEYGEPLSLVPIFKRMQELVNEY